MHSNDLSAWRHDHAFDAGNLAGERSTRAVMWIAVAMMMVEIAAGWGTTQWPCWPMVST